MANDFYLVPQLDTAEDVPKDFFKDQANAAIGRGLNTLYKDDALNGKVGRPVVVIDSGTGEATGLGQDGPMDLGRQSISGYLAKFPDDWTDATLTIDNDNAENYCGQVLFCNRATAISITIAASAGEGFNATFIQSGAGQVSIAGSLLTVRNFNGHTKTAGLYAGVNVVVRGDNLYLFGLTGA